MKLIAYFTNWFEDVHKLLFKNKTQIRCLFYTELVSRPFITIDQRSVTQTRLRCNKELGQSYTLLPFSRNNQSGLGWPNNKNATLSRSPGMDSPTLKKAMLYIVFVSRGHIFLYNSKFKC